MSATVTDILASQCETIVIQRSRFSEPLLRYAVTGLADIATVEHLASGSTAVISRRPLATFSRSETLLWAMLDDLVRGEGAALLEVADGPTLGAVADLWARLTLATYS